MSKVRLYGGTSGYIELSAPDVASNNTVELGDIPTVDTAATDGQVLAWNASLGKWEPITMKEKRIEAFTASGTFTVPAGVTYAIAHMMGGGGGIGVSTTGGDGSASSVDFAGGTVSSNGGNGTFINMTNARHNKAGQANSGRGGFVATGTPSVSASSAAGNGFDSTQIVAANTVTPEASITVTVGAGGTAGTGGAAGGSGYVYIEYYE